jgi:Uma2 family endonuclease
MIVAPDLAVEVISNSASAAETKVAEYLRGGAVEVWQIYLRERRVRPDLKLLQERSRSVNRAPWPGSDFTLTAPPC